MCALLLNLSCNQYGSDLGPQQSQLLSNYSGRELFRGLLIGDGPVADLIPVIKENIRIANFVENEGDITEARKMIDAVLDKLEQDDASVFDSFKKEMATGDHLVIRNALPKYAMLMLNAIEKVYGDNIPPLLMEGKGEGLAKLINGAFDKSMKPSEVKKVLADPKFQQDAEQFFKEFDHNAGNTDGRQQCVSWFAAVVVAVIYVVVVLEAVAAWTDVTVSWADGVVTMSSSGEGRSGVTTSLLKEELIDSVAKGFR